MKKIDALIVNPNALSEVYQDLSQNLAAIEPPVWASLIANHLRRKNYSVELIDCEGEQLNTEVSVRRVQEIQSKLVVVVVYGQQPSASTQSMHGASALCRKIRENNPNRKILILGGHVSALPQRTLEEEAVDFVCQGEGPRTITALLESNLEDEKALERVPGLWFMQDGKARHTEPASLVSQVDLVNELPGMAFDLLPMRNYRAHHWHCFDQIDERQPYASVYTSLGCPFRCTFCCIHAPFGGSRFRYWDPQFMISQFDVLAEKYGVRNIKIADEMFVLNDRHFLELCKLLKERNHGFNIWAYSRIDSVKPYHLEALKAAGVNWLAVGIESKSRFARDGVTKGKFQDEDIFRIVRQIKDAGIHVVGNYIFGLPDDDFQTMQDTLDLALELKCEMSNFYSTMAYPGSKLYQMASEQGWCLPESWLGYSQDAYETLPLQTKYVTAGEVLAFRDFAWSAYFTNPGYLSFIKEKFGQKTHDYLQGMNQRQLKRKYRAEIPDDIIRRYK